MRRSRTLISLGALLVAAATATTASAQGSVKLAIVAEITGGGAPSGSMWRDGILLAGVGINRQGGTPRPSRPSPVLGTATPPRPAGGRMRGRTHDRPASIP